MYISIYVYRIDLYIYIYIIYTYIKYIHQLIYPLDPSSPSPSGRRFPRGARGQGGRTERRRSAAAAGGDLRCVHAADRGLEDDGEVVMGIIYIYHLYIYIYMYIYIYIIYIYIIWV